MLSSSEAKNAKAVARPEKAPSPARTESRGKVEKRPNGTAFGSFLGAAP